MNQTLVAVTAIVVFGFLLAWYLYLDNNRYDIVGTEGTAYQIGKKTGTPWFIYSSRKEIHEGSKR